MLRDLAADENVDGRVLRALLLRIPDLSIHRVQVLGLAGKPDPEVLTWAAEGGYVLLTHDVSTMTKFTNERMRRGEPMPGLIVLPQVQVVGRVVDALELVIRAHEPEEVENRILFVSP